MIFYRDSARVAISIFGVNCRIGVNRRINAYINIHMRHRQYTKTI